jgi:hypothetical protein
MPLPWVDVRPNWYHLCGLFMILAETSPLAKHIYSNRTKEFVKVFLYHFQFVNWMLEDKQWVKLGGVDTSQMYQLFQTLFLLFWTLICMIWMELTRTDVVFSSIAMVLFLCRNKTSWIEPKNLQRTFLEYIKILAKRNTRGGATGSPQGSRARHPPGAPWWLVGPTWLRCP